MSILVLNIFLNFFLPFRLGTLVYEDNYVDSGEDS